MLKMETITENTKMAVLQSRLLHLLLSPTLLLLLLPFICADTDVLGEYCDNSRNITNAETSYNINRVLKDIVTYASADGFATSSAGAGSTRIYGLAQCRGDVNASDCQACLADAANQLSARCPNTVDGRIWFDYCFVRYDDKDFAGQVDTGVGWLYANTENVTEPKRFDNVLGKLFDKVRAQAVKPANEGLGKAQTKFTPSETLYALLQCTRDLSPLNCETCLAAAEENFQGFCQHKKGCRVLYSSCYVRYEFYPFYFPRTNGDKGRRASYTRAIHG